MPRIIYISPLGEELLRKVEGMEGQLKAILAELDPDFLQAQAEAAATQMATQTMGPVLGPRQPVDPMDGSCPEQAVEPHTLN
jgi:hypothetical protein